MLNVGLLGAGRIGGVHAQIISGHGASRLAAVSDAVQESAKAVADTYSAQVRTSKEIIGDPDIDAVLIATPTDTHSGLIEAATRAGKAVLCEKPVDLDLARAIDCEARVSKTGRPVMIGLNRRFDRNFSALKAALDSGEMGKPELLSITSFDPTPPPLEYIRSSGGLFRDMMIHDFDMANFLMGDLPMELSATGTSIVDLNIGEAGDVDTAAVTLRFKDGRIAVIKNSRRAAYGYDQRVEILCSEGLLQVENLTDNTVVRSTRDGVSRAKPTYFFLERYMSAYEAEWNAFVRAVTNNEQVPVSLADGVAALAMAEAATQSLQFGRPIALANVFKVSDRGKAS